MVAAKHVVYLLTHPRDLRAILQWKIWHDPVHVRDVKNESETEKQCFHYLNLTSRSFSAVIQELNPELLMPICLFYLVLRGLDTIEDDMTIDIKKKEPLLRNFADNIDKEGWTFTGNGPNEKDRELLVHFDVVVTELQRIKKPFFDIIRDITVKMGNGMADYALNAEHNPNGVNTIEEYELYCHYAAGLVGEGLTRLFVESQYANPKLLERPDLTESMSQFLQKTNIIRDVREDWEDKRRFWPKEVWSKYVDNWDDLFTLEHRQKALWCSSELVLNALKHADECLYYMAGMKEQSVFNFVAIPQAMAFATLELVFQNPAIFERNVKITRGDTARLMLASTQNLRVLCGVFRDYARRIHKKNDPRDPNFAQISAACGRIEQFIESIFPTQDPKVLTKAQEGAAQGATDQTGMGTKEAGFMILAVLGMLAVMGGLMVGLAWFLGAKFNNVFNDYDKAIMAERSQASGATTAIAHQEL